MSEYDDLLADADEVIEHLGEVVERLRTRIAELESKLAYLRWFHSNADFGPAHSDVVMAMQRAYPGVVPADYLYE